MTDPGAKILLVDDEEAIQKLLRFPSRRRGTRSFRPATARKPSTPSP